MKVPDDADSGRVRAVLADALEEHIHPYRGVRDVADRPPIAQRVGVATYPASPDEDAIFWLGVGDEVVPVSDRTEAARTIQEL